MIASYYTIVIFAALPLFTYIRKWPPSSLFGLASLAFLFFFATVFATSSNAGNYFLSNTDRAMHDRYFVIIQPLQVISTTGAMVLLFCLVRVQEFLSRMHFPRTTHVLFWVLNVSFWLPTAFLYHFGGSLADVSLADFDAIENYFQMMNRVAFGAMIAMGFAVIILVGLAIWSLLLRS